MSVGVSEMSFLWPRWPPGVSPSLTRRALTFPGSTICLWRAQVFFFTKVSVCVPAAGWTLKCQVPGRLWWRTGAWKRSQMKGSENVTLA